MNYYNPKRLVIKREDQLSELPTPIAVSIKEDAAEVLRLLKEIKASQPHLRLTQIIINACGAADPFYLEDEVLAQKLLAFAAKTRQ